MYETLVYMERKNYSLINLNRPESRNAMSSLMMEELSMAFDQAEYSKAHAVVIVGTGNTFCAGADLKEVAGLYGEAKINYTRTAQLLLQRIEESPFVVIAAMNGHAFGGGLELALACDIRVIVPNAKLGLTETKFGLNPAWGGSIRLPQTVGLGLSKYMVLTAEPITSEEAYAHGLVSSIVPGEEILDHCTALAEKLASYPLKSVMSVKKLFSRYRSLSIFEMDREQHQTFLELVKTKDSRYT